MDETSSLIAEAERLFLEVWSLSYPRVYGVSDAYASPKHLAGDLLGRLLAPSSSQEELRHPGKLIENLGVIGASVMTGLRVPMLPRGLMCIRKQGVSLLLERAIEAGSPVPTSCVRKRRRF